MTNIKAETTQEWTKEEEQYLVDARQAFYKYANDLKTKVSTDEMLEKFVNSMVDKTAENLLRMREFRKTKGVHLCKYCGDEAEGIDEDILCQGCRAEFGHSLYSEL